MNVERDCYRMDFRCRCGETWTREYEVRGHRSSGGTEMSSYFVDGQPAASPFRGVRCGRCGASPVACTGTARVARRAAAG